MIIGTAGHIDHGKSALVRRLTGTDPDRLKEEKARGITIDLGFAYWPRPDGATVGFVDVPGHEGLVHNMLAGATGIDFVLLVVAADDGVMPQTREHLAIMDLLGLTRGIVALNKADLVSPDRLAVVRAEIETELSATGLAGAEVRPVSALTGLGIDALVARLDAARAETAARAAGGGFRLAIDRVFTLTGLGTIVTGTVISGRVSVGDRVVLSPSGREARVRSIHAQNKPVQSGQAGERCALALTGGNVSKDTVKRGEMVQEPRLHAPTGRVDARLRVLAGEVKPIGLWMPVRVHHGAAEVGGRIVVLSDKPLPPGGTDFAQLVLEQPIAAAVGDRFIVRDVSARRTIGGGTLIDLRAPERRRRTPERRAELDIAGQPDAQASLSALLAGPRGWCDLDAFVRDRGLPASAAAELTAALGLVALPLTGRQPVLLPSAWADAKIAVGAALDRHHKEKPDQTGLSLDALRRLAAPRLPAPIFAAVIDKLVTGEAAAIDRGLVRRPSHGIKLSPQDAALWLRIRPLLAGSERFRPPRVRDIVGFVGRDESAVRRLMQLSAKRGETEEVAKDHYFLMPAVIEMAVIARRLDAETKSEGFSAALFRDQLDNGRKVAIQILEFFDAKGFTMRRGDLRRINPHKAEMFGAVGKS